MASSARPVSSPVAWRFPRLADVWNSNDGRLKGFIIGVHYATRCHPTMNKRHQDVLDAIIQVADDNGVVTLAQLPELADWAGASEKAVRARLTELSEAGFLEALPRYKPPSRPPALRVIPRDE